MADPDAVKRALSRLVADDRPPDGRSEPRLQQHRWTRRRRARGSNGQRRQPPEGGHCGRPSEGRQGRAKRNDDHRRVIADAAAVVEDLDRAAAFGHEVGLSRLGRAITAAERAGERTLARRGQRALAAYEWFERAATNGPPGAARRSDGGPDPEPSPSLDPGPSPSTDRARDGRSGSSTRGDRSRNQ